MQHPRSNSSIRSFIGNDDGMSQINPFFPDEATMAGSPNPGGVVADAAGAIGTAEPVEERLWRRGALTRGQQSPWRDRLIELAEIKSR